MRSRQVVGETTHTGGKEGSSACPQHITTDTAGGSLNRQSNFHLHFFFFLITQDREFCFIARNGLAVMPLPPQPSECVGSWVYTGTPDSCASTSV